MEQIVMNKGREIAKRRTIRSIRSYLTQNDDPNAEDEDKSLNFTFGVVENRLIWANFEHKSIWELNLDDLDGCDGGLTEFGISWHLMRSKSFQVQSLLKGITAEEFEEQKINISAV